MTGIIIGVSCAAFMAGTVIIILVLFVLREKPNYRTPTVEATVWIEDNTSDYNHVDIDEDL